MISHSYACEERFIEHASYPVMCPRAEGFLEVSDIHKLYYAVYGNPDGVPVILLHGGPGIGCSDKMTQFFDLSRWNVIMFDQRGAMRSEPFGCLQDNTPQHSIQDIETLRNHLKIEKWVVFGGSWGSTLALLYGQQHNDRCLGFILRGIFLAREIDHLHLFDGMGKIFPDAYEAVVNFIPEAERDNLFGAYCDKIFDPDPQLQLAAARIFMKFDLICSYHTPAPEIVDEIVKSDRTVISVMRLFCHYGMNAFFIENNQILSHMHKIKHLPAIIVQGRYDAICLPDMAYILHKAWNKSSLWIIPNGGHSPNERPMAAALASVSDLFVEQLHK